MDNYQREVVKRFAVGSERSRGSDAGGSSALSLLCLGLDPPHHEHMSWMSWICLPWPRGSEQSSVHSAVYLSAAVLHHSY